MVRSCNTEKLRKSLINSSISSEVFSEMNFFVSIRVVMAYENVSFQIIRQIYIPFSNKDM